MREREKALLLRVPLISRSVEAPHSAAPAGGANKANHLSLKRKREIAISLVATQRFAHIITINWVLF